MTEQGTVTAADGTALAYQVSGSGPVLLLLSGQANTHSWWDPVRSRFAAHRTVVTLDYRGTGASDAPPGPYSTGLFARDAAAVLEAVLAGTAETVADRADVYGTSMGGRVAQELAIARPELVRRLVLGCTSPGGPHAVERDKDVRRRLARSGPEAEAFLLELMYTPAFLARDPGPYPVLGDPDMPAHARVGHLMASNRHDAWDRLPSIGAPTLVLHGTDDVMVPTVNAGRIAGRIPGARLKHYPRARHAYFHELADQATADVLDFLSGRVSR